MQVTESHTHTLSPSPDPKPLPSYSQLNNVFTSPCGTRRAITPKNVSIARRSRGTRAEKGGGERVAFLHSFPSEVKKKTSKERLSGVENRWEPKCLPQIVNLATNLKEQIKRKKY
ncbi:hypothetical protein AVEN_10325-1 [Araneus ventricosus]|uniref:Uncharacterized protein n=1 Tax=Araneus ventricosus TaxID=182803 RepID=A0A4Y2PAA9_ARAVE|nr:hypothetical protein AVEN_10325-1 [Araneus ventricosus]